MGDMMKLIIASLLTLVIKTSFANDLQGVVTYKEKQASGVLFIFAQKFNGPTPMPLAVKRIPNPKFPYSFSLSAKDAMIKTIPFEGPFKVTARLTKSGDAADKSGPQGVASGPFSLGAKNIQIEMK